MPPNSSASGQEAANAMRTLAQLGQWEATLKLTLIEFIEVFAPKWGTELKMWCHVERWTPPFSRGESPGLVVLCRGCDALRLELAGVGRPRKRVDVVGGGVLLPACDHQITPVPGTFRPHSLPAAVI